MPTVIGMDVTAGEESKIYTINDCEGPITIRANSEKGINNNELFVKYCSEKENNIWTCDCDNSFDLIINTPKDVENSYNFIIKYYLEYKQLNESGREPSLIQIEQDNNVREKRINNINIKPKPENKTMDINFNIEAVNVIMVSIVIVIGILIILFFKFKNKFSINNDKSSNKDMLNYKVTNDEDIDNILNKIK